jgi:hypothetical protein
VRYISWWGGITASSEGGSRSPFEEERLSAATASAPTGCVLYAVNGFFAGVPGIADCIVYSPFLLVNLAFGFKFLVAGDAPSKTP